jgi:hypothetical protein
LPRTRNWDVDIISEDETNCRIFKHNCFHCTFKIQCNSIEWSRWL